MRPLLGYFIIISIIPLIFLLTIAADREWSNTSGIADLLDEKIPSEAIRLSETSFIKDRDGNIISALTNGENRILLKDGDIPDFLKKIFIVTEDRLFYEHAGFNAAAAGRAVIVNTRDQDTSQGGSTITQQLARNLWLSPEKTYNRKAAELLYAVQLERKLDKDQILGLYINAVYFHNGCYGIEAASRFYFSSPAKKLSRAQLAFLASIPNNPSAYNPLVHFDAAKKRQERLLKQLYEADQLSKSDFRKLIREEITLRVSKGAADPFPDYTDYVMHELDGLLADGNGLTAELSAHDKQVREQASAKLADIRKNLLASGAVIHTFLDPDIQLNAREAVQSRLRHTEAEGAAAVIQHHTHELVSLIGGKNYKKNTFHRGFQSYRQPGSAIKPLLVYAPYLEKTSAKLSESISAGPFCKGSYCPRNYMERSPGMVTLSTAFAQSYNTPAVRLLEKTGIETAFRFLQPFHFNKLTEKDRTLAAAAGGFTYGFSPLELTGAFTSFSDGKYRPARSIKKITDRNGKILYEWNESKQRVWSPSTTASVRRLLHETVVSGTARKAAISAGYIGGKTGTTNDVKDLWYIGLTEDYTTGVWIGKDRPASLDTLIPQAPHLTIWRDINIFMKARK